jgi:hypothetical protein
LGARLPFLILAVLAVITIADYAIGKKKSNDICLPFGVAVGHDQSHEDSSSWSVTYFLSRSATVSDQVWLEERSKKKLRLSSLLHKKKKQPT